MEFRLPELSYAYDALEPYIDARTMEIHHTKHHQGYVNNLNVALVNHRELQEKTLEQLLCESDSFDEALKIAIRNQGGGHWNHTFFWQLMKKNGGGEPRDRVTASIATHFGSFFQFQQQFNKAAQSVFGSGWAWLCVDQQNELKMVTTQNQDSPISQRLQPILGLDVWEHAYYLKYQNKRPDYIAAWWHTIDWNHVESLYENATR